MVSSWWSAGVVGAILVCLCEGQGGPGAAFYPPPLQNNLADEQLNLADNLFRPTGPHSAKLTFFTPVGLGDKPAGPKLLSIPKWLRIPSPSPTQTAWLCSLAGCAAVILCGVLPALFLPAQIHSAFHQQSGGAVELNRLLSFAVGSLLGDVFLHILPETWRNRSDDVSSMGLWTLGGLLVCFVVEKFSSGGGLTTAGHHQVTAAMNLVANLVDNFCHGLAVGGSFLVGTRFGLLTTFAILIHEIPHEISDFAILLRADFNRWAAVKAQLLTASGGVFGAIVALATSSQSDSISQSAAGWILPFTAGGFLHIALVQLLPDLLREKNRRESSLQLCILLSGIIVMGLVNCLPY